MIASLQMATHLLKPLSKLLEGLHHRGHHHLYCDSYYSSPHLFQLLRSLGFETCGTVGPNRKGIPRDFLALKGKDKMRKGEVKEGDITGVKIIQWMDKRPVTHLTTFHDSSSIQTTRQTRHAENGQEVITNPAAKAEYNQFMGRVDKSDQFLSYYTFHHRTLKWWKRAAFHLLNLVCVNAYIIY